METNETMKNNFSFSIWMSVILLACLLSFLTSAYIIPTSGSKNVGSFGKCTQDCPDGTQVSCTGTSLSMIDDPNDPGCICDGKEYRCSTKDKLPNNGNSNRSPANSNEEAKEKKKVKEKKRDKGKKPKKNRNANANAN